MRELIGVLSLGVIFLLSCGPLDPAITYDPEIEKEEASALSKEFEESGLEVDVDNFVDNVRIFLVDAPIDAKSVKVTLDGLGIHKSSPEEEWIKVDLDQEQFELLSLRNGASEILADISLDPGTYNKLRLLVTDAKITLQNDEAHELCIPENGRKNHINIPIDLVIEENFENETEIDEALNNLEEGQGEVETEEDAFGVVVDFDALESISEFETSDEDVSASDCKYVMRPKLKLKKAAKLFKKKRKLKKKLETLKNRLKKAKERMKVRKERRANDEPETNDDEV